MSADKLRSEVQDALDKAWTPDDDGPWEFVESLALDAILSIPMISAAPELLNAVKYFVADGVFDTFPEGIQEQMRALIAKAEGA